MAIEAKEIIAYLRSGMLYAVRISFKSASHHPFILGMALFLLLLYRCFPSLFALLVLSSPVIICTTILLGILLIYGEPNLPEIEEDRKAWEISAPKAESAANDLVVKKDESVMADARAETAERTVKAAASPSVEETDKEKHGQEKASEEREVCGQGHVEKREASGFSTKDQKETKGPKVEIDKPALQNRFDSSLGSPWQSVDGHNTCSDSESDTTESSTPDASMTEIIPMLDELHPLLDADAPQPASKSVDISDAASGEDHESDDGSTIDEEDHQEDEEDEDPQEEKDDGIEEVVKWTADDQKNLMDLGTSEMERNQRLENLMAKRIARKSLIPEIEGNLIDLDPVPTMEELSRLHVQIPPISAMRRNPFDLPDDSEETMGLPQIPGSAPSVLLPRRNPFDLPYDHVDQSGSIILLESSSHPQFVPVLQRDPFFRRHESFSVGASFYGEFKQEKRDSRLKPYFVSERAEETGFPTLQRQLSDKSDSKVSSVPESDTASSVEHHKELLVEGLHQESELLYRADHDAEPIEQESQSSEEADSVDADHEQNGNNVGDDRDIALNASMVTGETHQAADVGYDSSISDATKLEVIEDNYDELSSSSSEVNEKSPSKVSGDSMHSLAADSKLLSRAGERVGDGQVADPVYDLSPSASEKPLHEDLFHAGKRGLNSSSSLASDTQADISEVGSPPRPLEKNTSSGGGFECTDDDLAFASGGLWVAPPSLSSVDEIESRSRGVTEIRERDVIQVGLPGVHEEFVKPIALVLPRSVSGRIMHPSSLSSMETESSEDSS